MAKLIWWKLPHESEMRQPPYFPASVALSLLLHAAALAAWLNNSTPPPPIPLDSRFAPQENTTLAVALISLPSDHQRDRQQQLRVASQDKSLPAVKVDVAAKKNTTTPSSHPQKIKPKTAKPANNLRQGQTTKGMPLARANAEQAMKTLVQARAYDNPSESFAHANLAQQPTLANTNSNSVATTARSGHDQPAAPAQASDAKPAKPNNHHAEVSDSALPPLIKSGQPRYPEEARWEARTGKVTFTFRISDRGRILEPRITVSSGHRDLDLAALQAIKDWQFRLQAGWDSSRWFFYSFRFELR